MNFFFKDIAKSLEFYTGVLGMQLVADFHFEQWKFSVYFLAYVKPENIPDDPTAKMAFLWNQPACLELTHNHGSGKLNSSDWFCYFTNQRPRL